MRKGLWRCAAALLSAVILLTMSVSLVSADTTETDGVQDQTLLPYDRSQTVCETDRIKLYFDSETTVFCVENKSTGYRWSSAPETMEADGTNEYVRFKAYSLLYMEYYNVVTDVEETVYSYENSVQLGNYTWELLDNGVKVVFTFEEIGATIPLLVTLDGDCFTVTVDVRNMVYDADAIIPLRIAVTPYLCAGGGEAAQGYALIADGSGALVSFAESKTNVPEYSKPVYGKDMTVDALDESGILLPCYGVNYGTDSLLAVVSEAAENAYVHCEGRSDLSAYTHVWSAFTVLASQSYEIKEGTGYSTEVYEEGGIKAAALSVSYYVINSEKSGYAAMAERYRRVLFTEEQVSDAAVEPALYMDVYATVSKVKSILGFQVEYDSVLTSAEDLRDMIDALAAVGVNSTAVRYNTWSKQENNGRAVTKATWKSSLGDVSGMIADLQEQGCAVYPSINRIMTYESSLNPFHSLTNAVRDLSSTLVMGETTRYVKASYFFNYKTLQRNTKKLFANLQKQEFTQAAVDDFGNILYSDFSGDVNKRNAFIELVQTTLADYTKNGKLMCTAPNAYAAVYADELMALPTASSGNAMFDKDVPFLQLVYSGIVRYGSESLNLSGNPEQAFLKALETGSMPCYAWVGKNADMLIHSKLDYLFSADYTYWLDTASAQYKTLAEILSLCENTPMVDHAELMDGVTVSYYGNGAEIVINYNDHAVTLADGSTVEANTYYARKGA